MATAITFKDARRLQQSILAGPEKRALVWMARRTPAAINSDHLTALGFLSMIMTGASFALARWYEPALLLVILFLFLNWLGDSLDGTLARVRRCQRPRYGFYVDHVLDSAGAAALFAGLALSGYMTPLVAAGVVVAFLLLSVESYLTAYARGQHRLSFGIFGPTELRLLLIAGAVTLFFRPVVDVAGRSFLLFDVGGVCAIVGMGSMFAWAAARNTCALYREETRP